MLAIETLEGKRVYLKDIERVLNKVDSKTNRNYYLLLETIIGENIRIEGTDLKTLIRKLITINNNIRVIPVGLATLSKGHDDVIDLLCQSSIGNVETPEYAFIYLGNNLFNVDNIEFMQFFCNDEDNNYYIEIEMCSGKKILINDIVIPTGVSPYNFLEDIMDYIDRKLASIGKRIKPFRIIDVPEEKEEE